MPNQEEFKMMMNRNLNYNSIHKLIYFKTLKKGRTNFLNVFVRPELESILCNRENTRYVALIGQVDHGRCKPHFFQEKLLI